MARSVEQQIAEAQAKISSLREKQKKLATRQKIIVGAVLIEKAKKDAKFATDLTAILEKTNLRDTDKKALLPLIQELKGV